MISKNKKTTLKWAVATLALTLVVGCSSLTNSINLPDGQTQKDSLTNSPQTDTAIPNSPTSSTDANSIVYRNTQYGFYFTLPESWKGYFIVRIIPFAVLKAQKFMKVPLSGYNAFG